MIVVRVRVERVKVRWGVVVGLKRDDFRRQVLVSNPRLNPCIARFPPALTSNSATIVAAPPASPWPTQQPVHVGPRSDANCMKFQREWLCTAVCNHLLLHFFVKRRSLRISVRGNYSCGQIKQTRFVSSRTVLARPTSSRSCSK